MKNNLRQETAAEAPQDARVPAWHCLPVEAVSAQLEADVATGLTQTEAASRLSRYGPNAIQEGERRSPWRMLLDQFTDFMIIVLLVAAVVSGFIGEPIDTIAIVVIVLMNGTIGFIQEYRAERAMAALKKLAAATARVLRDGAPAEIPAANLVPGDVVLLEAGNVVPADLRLFEAVVLKTEEAALTGESVPIEKRSAPVEGGDLALGDRRNMAYKGTTVAYGRGRGLVVATGMQTELGKIATLLAQESEVKTPLQKRLAEFGRKLAIAALAICGVVFVFGLLRGEPIALMFLTAVSLAVAAIPEALPAVVTISLALGAHRMVKRNALIRRLPAVEALGSVTYICSDKTGTLTQNRMHVEDFWIEGRHLKQPSGEELRGEAARLLLTALALNNDASAAQGGAELGDPTEIALLNAARRAGYAKDTLERANPRVAELPFDSERKLMTTVHRDGSRLVAYTKGAPEKLVERCRCALRDGQTVPLDVKDVLERAERMATEGLRVIGVAYRLWDRAPDPFGSEKVESELVFLGLVGMIDPPRAEVFEAVELCKSAGITPVMVTGDHPATARAIAQRLRILGEGGKVLTGQEMSRLSAADFEREVRDVRVYARVDPAQKIMIVAGLQAKGEFVAMTGDGVNDAPAIKRAEIGVAMGKIGTDVAREASSMVLLDDNFATIVSAVREGRRIYDNIRKFIRFVMGGNSGEIWTIAVATFMGLPLPLLPIHILWINLVTDGLPGLALAGERAERDIMSRPARAPSESIFARGMWQHILWVGVLIGAICIGIQLWATAQGTAAWQTMVFTALTMCQMYHVLAIRSERDSLLTIGIFSNRYLTGAVLLTLGLQLAIIYTPVLNPIFKTQPLGVLELAVSLLLPGLVLAGVELEKLAVRRGWMYRERPRAQPVQPREADGGRPAFGSRNGRSRLSEWLRRIPGSPERIAKEVAMLKVLLPLDDANKLDHVVRYVAWCQRESSQPVQIHVLHVEPAFSTYVASKLPRGTLRRYHDERSRAVLEPAAAALARLNVTCKTRARVGDPVNCIVDYARDAGIDRIALVTHSRQTLPEVLLGSVTAGVLQQATVPVEVVPIEPGSALRVYARAAGAGATILTLVYLAVE
jgi:Ca2+-transporting ATPase